MRGGGVKTRRRLCRSPQGPHACNGIKVHGIRAEMLDRDQGTWHTRGDAIFFCRGRGKFGARVLERSTCGYSGRLPG